MSKASNCFFHGKLVETVSLSGAWLAMLITTTVLLANMGSLLTAMVLVVEDD